MTILTPINNMFHLGVIEKRMGSERDATRHRRVASLLFDPFIQMYMPPTVVSTLVSFFVLLATSMNKLNLAARIS
jgi:hypothetical protein